MELTNATRQWGQLLLPGLLLAVVLVIVLAVALPVAALVLSLALLGSGLAMVVQRAGAAARSVEAAVRGTAEPDAPSQPTLKLELAEGVVLNARPVPLAAPGEHTLLLTREGYIVVNAEGQVLHRIA